MVKHLVYSGGESDVLIADTFIKRFLGYMFRKQPHYEAVLIKPCNSIHTFFMRFDIDVLFLDEDMRVVGKVEKLGPNKVVMPVRGAVMVVEAAAGMFYDVALGDVVKVCE